MDALDERWLAAVDSMAKGSVEASIGADDGMAALNGQGSGSVQSVAMENLLRRQAAHLVQVHRFRTEASACDVNEKLVQRRLDDLASVAVSHFYAYRFDRVPAVWRCLYTDALVLSAYGRYLTALATAGRLASRDLDAIVENLDRALIITGGASSHVGASWIKETLQALEKACCDSIDDTEEKASSADDSPPLKRQRRLTAMTTTATFGESHVFSIDEPYGRPQLAPDKACPRHRGWTLDRFEAYMAADGGKARPVVFTDLMNGWPALADQLWKQPGYLLSKTFGGRRLIPIEVGRSYVDEGWGQEVIPFRTFLAKYIVGPNGLSPWPAAHDLQRQQQQHRQRKQQKQQKQYQQRNQEQMGYLAQHNLFRQIPRLRNDIAIPDFCWAAVPPHPTDPSTQQPLLETPQLHAWFGPAGTITPLHTDAYHNLLCQVVGAKYVRLYPPHAGPALRPYALEHGVDMSNTSRLDLGLLEGWDESVTDGVGDANGLDEARQRLRGVEYWECVLQPGDSLLIPIGWWHYVRSLSISFSVSFWWN